MDKIIVTDILGNEVIKVSPNDIKVSLDLSGKSNGIYFVKIIIGNAEQVHKLVLNK